MGEERYTNRELDMLHNGLKTEITAFREDMEQHGIAMRLGFEGVHKRLDITNGKVKKIIIGLVALAAFAIGLGVAEGRTLLTFLLAL